MLADLLVLLLGLALIVFGADYLVEGASRIARKAGVSQFVIGLTIVGMGTSAPEFVVSMIGAFKGSADIAIGNVLGSNIFNTLLILGVTAFILPIAITKNNFRRDLPVNLGVTLLFLVLGFFDGLSRIDGAILLACFALYIWYCFRFDEHTAEEEEDTSTGKLAVNILLVLGGLAALVFGGRFFVNSATALAYRMGASEKFVAVTILAGGTSLPELATCVVAAVKKKGALALGNIIGSNLFNILLILGCSAVITPLSFAHIKWVDAGVLTASALLLMTAAFTGKNNKIDRLDGGILLAVWVGYLAWLIVNISV